MAEATDIWDDSEHPDTSKVRELRAEIERLKLLAYSNLGDNHHNANDCPYCKAALENKP